MYKVETQPRAYCYVYLLALRDYIIKGLWVV